MNAITLHILVHYYYEVRDFRDGDLTAPAVRDAVSQLRAQDLIAPTNGDEDAPTYELTDKGKVYVRALLRVPLPVQAWAMPAPYGEN